MAKSFRHIGAVMMGLSAGMRRDAFPDPVLDHSTFGGGYTTKEQWERDTAVSAEDLAKNGLSVFEIGGVKVIAKSEAEAKKRLKWQKKQATD